MVEVDELPEGTDISGNWKFDNGIISRIPVNYARKLEAMRQSYLNQAYEKINDWRTELQLGTISDEDRAALTQWMAYISQVKKMELPAIKTEAEFNAIKWLSSHSNKEGRKASEYHYILAAVTHAPFNRYCNGR